VPDSLFFQEGPPIPLKLARARFVGIANNLHHQLFDQVRSLFAQFLSALIDLFAETQQSFDVGYGSQLASPAARARFESLVRHIDRGRGDGGFWPR
jgi:hypothetical protein